MTTQPLRDGRRWRDLTPAFFETSTAFLQAFGEYLTNEGTLPSRQSRGVRLVRAGDLRKDEDLSSKFRASSPYRAALRQFYRAEADLRRRFRRATYYRTIDGALENARDWLKDARSVSDEEAHHDHAIGLAIIALEEIGKATMGFNAANGIVPLTDFEWFTREHVSKIESSSLPALSLDIAKHSGFLENYEYVRILRRIRKLLGSGHSVDEIRQKTLALFNPVDEDLHQISPRFNKHGMEKLDPLEIQDLKHWAIYRGQDPQRPDLSEEHFERWFDLVNGALNNATVAFSDRWSLSPEVLELASEIKLRLDQALKAVWEWLEAEFFDRLGPTKG